MTVIGIHERARNSATPKYFQRQTENHHKNKNMYRNIALTLTAAAFAHNALCGQFDWPQWQGPDRNAVSRETGLLKEWAKDGPPLAWKAKGLGGGDSAPSVASGRIYGMSHRGADEIVWALSEKD